MDVITVDSAVWRELTGKIDNIDLFIRENAERSLPLEEMWVDSNDVCEYLSISDRTLQRLRSKGRITYSKVGKRCYYTLAEIRRTMEARIIRRPEEQLGALIQYHQTRLKKR